MNDLDNLKTMVSALLGQELPTQEKIRDHVEKVRRACPDVTDEQADECVQWFEKVHGVTMTDGATLKGGEFEQWLDDARSSLEPYYWERYRMLLVDRKFSHNVLTTMDRVTDRILGLLENPTKEGKWDRRGMVMGHVQSGKTANYTGLVCKAADAGYRVIIIIAGIHNNLRNQTQRRIDEGFVGFDSTGSLKGKLPRQSVLGVGCFDSRRRPNVFTNSQRDFNKVIADSVGTPLQNLIEPAVFVIKKHSTTLRNLIEWLSVHNAQRGTDTVREPMLLIDDEADNASINIRHRQEEVSRINGQIRELLSLFDRSCYIGYTATPIANIFIDPGSEDAMLGDDLFPRDFIVSLDPPANYFGPTDVFFEDEGPGRIVRPIDDHADLLPLKHKIDHKITELPESLVTAVRVFVVARAIRLVRRQDREHNSMLVNVSRFLDIQKQVRNNIHTLVERIRGSLRVNGARPLAEAMTDPEIAALRQAFEDHYAQSCPESWPSVQARLYDSISAVNVIEVNSRSPDALDYVKRERAGLNVIAVGGLSLSRGLTLEGLVVSYFLRNSMMYDTLLQMGRWFGFRQGYKDLCRVWMTEEAQGWYTHITRAIDELREEVIRMQRTNATPREFGLRVRSHPDTLVVTARNKMGSGVRVKVFVGLANSFIETAILRRDRSSLTANRRAATLLAANLRKIDRAPESGDPVGGGRLVHSVSAQVVDAFLMAFQNHEGSIATQTDPVRRYIEERTADELGDWDICFPGLIRDGAPPSSLKDSSLGFPLICQRRAAGPRSNDATLMVTSKQRVSSRGIERTGLTDAQVLQAEKEFMRRHPNRKNIPDWIYREVRTRPLLVVHMLAIGEEGEDLSAERPIVAWSISFPTTRREEQRVEYVVNVPWWEEHYGDEEDELDENDD